MEKQRVGRGHVSPKRLWDGVDLPTDKKMVVSAPKVPQSGSTIPRKPKKVG